jgi:hypothetical protein
VAFAQTIESRKKDLSQRRGDAANHTLAAIAAPLRRLRLRVASAKQGARKSKLTRHVKPFPFVFLEKISQKKIA